MIQVISLHNDGSYSLLDCNQDNMMYNIVNAIHMTPDDMGDTAHIYTTSDTNYDMVWVDSPNLPKNELATILNHEKDVFGHAVVMKFSIDDNGSNHIQSMTMQDMEHLIKNIRTYTCTLSKANGDMIDITYDKKDSVVMDNVSSLLGNLPVSDIYRIDISLFKCNLSIYCIKKTSEKVNKNITALLGNHIVCGPCVIVYNSNDLHKTFQGKKIRYLDHMTSLLLKKIIKCAKCPLEDRVPKDCELEAIVDNKNGDKCIISTEFILKHRLNSLKHNALLCEGCYRVHFASKEDQKDQWHIHKKECLYNQEPLNYFV